MRNAFRLLASLTALASTAAVAADYDPPLVIEQEMPIYEEVVPVEIGTGWYLRGDIGYAVARSTAGPFTFRTFDMPMGNYATTVMDSTRYPGGFDVGVGFGYRVTDWFRADVMLERFSSTISGNAALGTPCLGQLPGTTCNQGFNSNMTGYSLMANAFVDLGTVARFTPYVGVGAGLVRANWKEATVTDSCVPGALACLPPAAPETLSGATSYHFSYAAMAGVAYDISKNLKLDVGYRFRGVTGSAGSNGFSAREQAQGAAGTKVTVPGFVNHEIRVGLRYELW